MLARVCTIRRTVGPSGAGLARPLLTAHARVACSGSAERACRAPVAALEFPRCTDAAFCLSRLVLVRPLRALEAGRASTLGGILARNAVQAGKGRVLPGLCMRCPGWAWLARRGRLSLLVGAWPARRALQSSHARLEITRRARDASVPALPSLSRAHRAGRACRRVCQVLVGPTLTRLTRRGHSRPGKKARPAAQAQGRPGEALRKARLTREARGCARGWLRRSGLTFQASARSGRILERTSCAFYAACHPTLVGVRPHGACLALSSVPVEPAHAAVTRPVL